MPDITFSSFSTLRIEFGRGGDMMLKLSVENEEEGRRVAGTFLYGSGKMGMMENSTPEEDRLVHLFAPLARGERCQISGETVTNRFLRFATPRGDHVAVSADQAGDIVLCIEGQDVGFASTVETKLKHSDLSDEKARFVYGALHQLLAGFGKPA